MSLHFGKETFVTDASGCKSQETSEQTSVDMELGCCIDGGVQYCNPQQMAESVSADLLKYSQDYFEAHLLTSVSTRIQGTAITEEEEFHEVYGLSVTVVPTHKPRCRIDHEARVFLT